MSGITASNGGYSLFVTATAIIVPSSVVVCGRLFSRISTGKFGLDDVLISIALVSSILLTIFIDLSVANGYGQPSLNMTEQQKEEFMKWFFLAQIFYKLVLGFTKTSILALYIRIFITSAFQRVAYVLLVVVSCWAIATILTTILQCVPIVASWRSSVENAKCINKDVFWYAFAISNTATDFTIFLLPVYPIVRLHLPWRDKIGLLFVFAIGAFVCATSILRTLAVTHTTIQSADPSLDFIPRSIWTIVEANTGIICSSIPMLKYYFHLIPCTCRKPEQPHESAVPSPNTPDPISGRPRERNGQKLSKPSEDTLILRDSCELSPEQLRRIYGSLAQHAGSYRIELTTQVSISYNPEA